MRPRSRRRPSRACAPTLSEPEWATFVIFTASSAFVGLSFGSVNPKSTARTCAWRHSLSAIRLSVPAGGVVDGGDSEARSLGGRFSDPPGSERRWSAVVGDRVLKLAMPLKCAAGVNTTLPPSSAALPPTAAENAGERQRLRRFVVRAGGVVGEQRCGGDRARAGHPRQRPRACRRGRRHIVHIGHGDRRLGRGAQRGADRGLHVERERAARACLASSVGVNFRPALPSATVISASLAIAVVPSVLEQRCHR